MNLLTLVYEAFEPEIEQVVSNVISDLEKLGHKVKEVRVANDSGEKKIPLNQLPAPAPIPDPVPPEAATPPVEPSPPAPPVSTDATVLAGDGTPATTDNPSVEAPVVTEVTNLNPDGTEVVTNPVVTSVTTSAPITNPNESLADASISDLEAMLAQRQADQAAADANTPPTDNPPVPTALTTNN